MNKACAVIGGQFVLHSHPERVARAGLNAEAAENAAHEIYIVNLGPPFDAVIVGGL